MEPVKSDVTKIISFSFIMDVSDRDNGCCVKEKWNALFKPKGKHLEALQMCTEGLGFESSHEIKTDTPKLLPRLLSSDEITHNENINRGENENCTQIPKRNEKTATVCSKFPPPLPSIARNSQAGIFMRSFKKDGRFVLQEVKKLPSQEVLHAWRGDGRLKLQLIPKDDHSNDEI